MSERLDSRESLQNFAGFWIERKLDERYIAYPDDPDSLGASAAVYEKRMNLPTEFFEMQQIFNNGLIVWDVGAGTAKATSELQDQYGQAGISFLAINSHILPDSEQYRQRVPFVRGYMEQITGRVRREAEKYRLYPPTMILISNALPYTTQTETEELSFSNLATILPTQGRVLIYDGIGEKSYPYYKKVITQLQLPFIAEEKSGEGSYPFYLSLTKTS